MHAPDPLPAVLPTRHGHGTRGRWRLADAAWAPHADAVLEALARGHRPEEVEGVTVLRAKRGRWVARIERAGRSAVAKAFPMRRWGDRLRRWRQCAPAEAAHLAEAARRGVPVPALYGLGETRRAGLVHANYVLMEDLRGHASVYKLLDEAADPEPLAAWVLPRTARLLLALWRTGVNHIDPHMNSVWLSRTDPADDRLIDFQYARFHEAPSLNLLMFHAAHYARTAPQICWDPKHFEPWVQAMLEEAGAGDPGPWMERYREFFARKLSKAERLALR